MGVSGITITRDEALWNIAAFHPLARMSLIKDGWDPRNNILGQTSVNHLSAICLGQQRPHLNIYYTLLNHCLKTASFRVKKKKKNAGRLFHPSYPKYKSKSHMFLHILRLQNKALPGHSLFSSELQTLLVATKMYIFSFQNTNAGLFF